MASLTPAERTGFAQDRGSLEPGKLADIVILSRDLYVRRTFINGVEFHGMAWPSNDFARPAPAVPPRSRRVRKPMTVDRLRGVSGFSIDRVAGLGLRGPGRARVLSPDAPRVHLPSVSSTTRKPMT